MLDSHRLGKTAKAVAIAAAVAMAGGPALAGRAFADEKTTTPIKHVLVIFQENVLFDHCFATYPGALNPKGEPKFVARPGTPSVNGLGTLVDGTPTGVLLTDNPNAYNPANGSGAIEPYRLGPS
jgi:phospholipase C